MMMYFSQKRALFLVKEEMLNFDCNEIAMI